MYKLDLEEDTSIVNSMKLSQAFTKIQLCVGVITEYLIQKDFKKEGIDLIEARKVSDKEVENTLINLKKSIDNLAIIEQKYKFNTPSLREKYEDELRISKAEIEGIIHCLNFVWNKGDPLKNKEVPYKGTTNYQFIYSHLVFYMNRVNKLIKQINEKVKVFNKRNKNLKDLPFLPVLTSPPNWANKYKIIRS